ncbi:hypothetical protein CULT_1610015 [[Clostridium] ultunense Esp]|nr:hypothetical protein CULT_1610015 [[Clostridium] ultunense Esp]
MYFLAYVNRFIHFYQLKSLEKSNICDTTSEKLSLNNAVVLKNY